MNFEKLEQIREERQISVDDLAKKLGIHRSTWYRWISGKRKNVSFENIKKACEVLDVDIKEII